MAEYIDKTAAVEALRAKAETSVSGEWAACFYTAAKMIELFPAAAAAPAAHGRWLVNFAHEDRLYADCSICRERVLFMHNYCPGCGAKMAGWTEVTSDATN